MKEKQEKEHLVLAIFPNSHGFGYAIFEGPQHPIDWGIFRARFQKNMKSLKRIREYMDFYHPDRVIVEDISINNSRKRYRVRTLILNILKLANDWNISSNTYSLKDVEDVFSSFQVKTKYERAKKISEWMPAVGARLPEKNKPWVREDYRMGIFDAISLAITFYYHDREEFPYDNRVIYT